VPHAGLSSALGIGTLTASSRWHCGEKTTKLSGVESELSGVKSLQRQRSLAVSGQRLGAPDRGTGLSGAPPNCPVCRGEHNFSPTTSFVLGAINTPPTGHFHVWEPKRHNKAYSRHSQVLLHPSA
jgi:hypothetical protein